MPREILVPIDGSEPAWEALSFALEHHPLADITAYYVIDLASLPDESAMESAIDYETALAEAREERAEQVLADAEQRAAQHTVDRKATSEPGYTNEEHAEYDMDFQTEYDRGYPREEIVEYAENHDIDQLIVGSHGRTGLTRFLLGSVAEKVIRQAPVPVTVVRPEATGT